MFLKYLCEFLGTMMLILLGDGVVANVTLNKSGMKGAGSIQITLAWGLAVMVPAFIFGEASGASFNPRADHRTGSRRYVRLGAGSRLCHRADPPAVSSAAFWSTFSSRITLTRRKIPAPSSASSPPARPSPILSATSCRKPSRPSFWFFAICGLNQVPQLAAGVGKLLVFGIIVSIGMSLGGLTGYALNPARDLGPRIAHAILPHQGQGLQQLQIRPDRPHLWAHHRWSSRRPAVQRHPLGCCVSTAHASEYTLL